MSPRTSARAAAETPADRQTTREDWLAAALDLLIEDGEEKVKVLPIAQRINGSRSSFYWYFRNREQLLDELLAIWRDKNTAGILARAAREVPSISDAVLSVFECWVDEDLFDPRLDFAIREWARRSEAVRAEVEAADTARVDALMAMYARHGFSAEAAYVRARTLYYMQIGYYALDLNETTETRLAHVADYVEAFSGEAPGRAQLDRFVAFVNDLRTRRQTR